MEPITGKRKSLVSSVAKIRNQEPGPNAHASSVRSNTCRGSNPKKKAGVELEGEIFLLTFLLIGHPKRVALVYGPTVLVKRKKLMSADALPKFSKTDQKLTFGLRPSSEDEFVPFSSQGLHEPYEMYFDLG